MDPITIIAALSAGIKLVKELAPVVQDMFNKGQITKEQQEEVMKEFQSLKTGAGGEFAGPEWQPSTESEPSSSPRKESKPRKG